MTWPRRIALTIGLTAAFFAGSMAGPARSDAITSIDAKACLGGNRSWYDIADNDVNKEYSYYSSKGWNIVDLDYGSNSGTSHDWWTWMWFKTANGTKLWTKFRVRDPAASADGYYHDWVGERA